MQKLNAAQVKSLADFCNMLAAAWFSTGIIVPLFTKPNNIIEFFRLLIIGFIMTFVMIELSLYLLRDYYD